MHVLHAGRIGMQGVRFLCMCLRGVLVRVRGELPDRSAVKIWKRIFEVVLARVRGEPPARSAGDAGMVPLTSRAAAKGGERGDSCYGHIGIF